MVKPLMLALMTWASAHTGLPVPDTLPQVQRLEHCALQAVAWPRVECDSSQGPVAVYDHRAATIYLPQSWSPHDLYHVSVLLHELVHHMQAEAGIEMTGGCSGQRVEQPAYDAQIDWLEAAGVDPLKVMGVNAFYLRFRTSCGIYH